MANDAALSSNSLRAAKLRDTQTKARQAALRAVLMPLASLKLTVALLAMGMFLVFAGTFALTKYDMWDVVRNYFRTPFTWIDLQIFFPPAFFPSRPQVPGGFPFPGGWVIGGLMFINLVAAHSVRFTVQTRGTRLIGGLAVIALGLLVTWLVIRANEDREGAQTATWISYDALWAAFKWGVVLLAGGAVAATVLAFTRMDARRQIERWALLVVSVALAGVGGYLLFAGDSARMSDPSMRILSQLISATFAGLVLLAGCVLAFKKRAGIVVLHFGIGLLMFNELWVDRTHVEAQITLEDAADGGRPDRVVAGHVHDVRELELAVIERGSGADGKDKTVAISEALLLDDGTITGRQSKLGRILHAMLPKQTNDDDRVYRVVQSDELPVDVQVLKFYRNAAMRVLGADEVNQTVDAGHGRYHELVGLEPVSGVDKGENQPAAYVRFFAKGTSEPLSTHMVSVEQTLLAHWQPSDLSGLEEVRAGGKTYEVYLRYKRINKPYTITLLDVRRDNYLGTNTPQNYSSDVHIDGTTKQGQDVATKAHIWMNNPLRMFGDTIYQSGHHEAGFSYGERSTLSVVTNGGWMIPYVCCMIVAVGMCYQFLLTLMRFLSRMATPSPSAAAAEHPVELARDTNPRGNGDSKRSSRGDASRAAAGGAGQGGGPSNRRDKRDRQQRSDRQTTPAAATTPRPWGRFMAMYFPIIVLVFFVGWLGGRMRPTSTPEGQMRVLEFGKTVAVVHGGRPKPIDSLARNSLLVLSGKQEYVDYRVTDDDVSAMGKVLRVVSGNPDAGKPKTPAIFWLLDLMSGRPVEGEPGKRLADQQRVVRVESVEVQRLLGLEQRKGFLYSFDEINQNRRALQAALKEARAEAKANSRGMSALHRQILKLNDRLSLYMVLRESHELPPDDLLAAVAFVLNAAEPEAESAFDEAPFLAPHDPATKPWEPLAFAAARTQIHQWARKYEAKTPAKLERALLSGLVVGAIDAQAEELLIQGRVIETIESVLSREGEKQRSPEDLRRQAIARYRELPDRMRIPLEDRIRQMLAETPAADLKAERTQAREAVLSDRAAIVTRVEETYGPRIRPALKRLVGDAPLGESSAVNVALTKLMGAARRQNVSAFNDALDEYQTAIAAAAPRDYKPGKVRFEAFFNHAAPFYYAAVIHLFAFLLVAASWMGWRRPLNRASFWLIVLALVIQTVALIARIYISGRPPVTNLYSSAVFIGFGAVLFGIVIELIYGLGIGNVLASVAGFSTLLIAHYLSLDGDTFTVLQAVLDTQFWLATHVVCITLGYATTFVAGLLGMRYVISGILSPSLTPEISRLLGRLIYGVICFGLFFSFVGTILGGLWADDSWGRFWGWDPKENGALMIVIWNAIVLHARWGGMVKDRGLAVLAMGGNIVTAWSWFAVNELGIGLHSYGFTEGVMLTLSIFWATQIVLIIVGSLPKSWWWSFSVHGDGAGQGGA